MGCCGDANVILGLLTASLILYVCKLLLELKQCKEENDQWKVKFDRLVMRLNELEVYSDPAFINKMGDMYL